MTAETQETRVLVTGGSGFIGTSVISCYAARGWPVTNFDILPPRNSAQQMYWQPGDVLDKQSVRRAFSDFDPTHVLHLAARTDLEGSFASDYPSNVIGVANILEGLREAPSLRRVIFASSRLVCRIGYQPRSDDDYCPSTAYGASKAEGERIVRSRTPDVDWVIVRPTSIWGPWFDAPYRTFFLSIARGRYVHPRGARIRKSFGFVGNTVYQLDRLLLGRGLSEETIYLGDYPPLDLKAWAELIRAELGAPQIRTAPLIALRAAAVGGDSLQRIGWRDPPLTRFRLDNLMSEMVFDLQPIREAAGPLPFSTAAGVARTASWLRAEGLLPASAARLRTRRSCAS